jgi:Putative lumazine-binding
LGNVEVGHNRSVGIPEHSAGRLGSCLALALAVTIMPLPALAQSTASRPSGDEQAVLDVVEMLFEFIHTKDANLVERMMVPDGVLVGVGGGRSSRSSRDEFASSVGSAEAEMVERMWSPEVRMDGQVAQVWAPYDFYIDGAFSHCGFDAFHLVRVDGEWKTASVTYSRAQPPTCEMHPGGPPR